MNQMQAGNGRNITAISLIGLGALFLLAQIFNFSIFGLLWPFFVILPGAAFLAFALKGDKSVAGLAVPGTVITGTGLILLYQSITGNWASWAYAWTLYPVFVGLALIFMGQRTGDGNTHNAGRGLVKWGGVAFIIATALFELVIFGGGSIFGTLALPLLLIGFGLFMLFGRNSRVLNEVKAKRDDGLFTGPRVIDMKPKNNAYTPGVSDDLQRQIDDALAEKEEPVSSNGTTTL
jgi:hypothetical protein